MAKNKKGQFTSEKIISKKLSKALLELGKEVAVRVKPLVRDELETELRHQVYASYTPATDKGKAIKEYNDTHKHQKPASYHHTGTLVSNIYCTIDGDIVAAKVRDAKYDNGESAAKVYNYLKFGTTNSPKNDTYAYANGTKFSRYIAQEPHNFEARTREHMKIFLDELAGKLKNNPEQFYGKYLDKVQAKFFNNK